VTAIAIPAEVCVAMYRHARATFPAECCGYLVGPRDAAAVDAAVACRNAQADGEHPIAPERGDDTGFVIAGGELFRFARSFDGDRPPRIIYHSHTNGRAYLSTIDRALADGPAYPVQHVVIGVTADALTEVAQFAWSATAAAYVEVARWQVQP
jgi:proteasome lid subunit RPN8/RPN11